MKTTMWTTLYANECTVVMVDERNGNISSVKIKHASLRRPLWFSKSQAGNWYWRNTRGANDLADGYTIKGELDGTVGAPREYPELAVLGVG
jgi:hypothetical protein